MSIITLISDWNRQDYYLAVVKARLIAALPGVEIVDISHSVSFFNNTQTSFLLRAAYPHFPEGTVHLVAVNCESTPNNAFIAVSHEKQFFLLADNGICGLLFPSGPEQVVKLDLIPEAGSFAALEVLVPAAVHLANGESILGLGSAWNDFKRLSAIVPMVDDQVITGSVAYIDSYRNVITNITRDLFEKVGQGKTFEIFVQSNHYKITSLNHYYTETSPGELLALFNSTGNLEIAICNGNAADLLNIDYRSVIRVRFLKR